MLRSLFSSISGLRSNQTLIDVTGNNIANVNTTGFKGSTVQFQESFSQTLAGAGRPDNDIDTGLPARGGTNPSQIGLGVTVAGVTANMGQGAAQATGRQTDMMIQGDGFFVVRRNGQDTLTRNGAFGVDAAGNLVNVDGSLVLGYGEILINPDGSYSAPGIDPATGEVDPNSPVAPLAIPTNSTVIDAEGNTFPVVAYNIGQDGRISVTYGNGDVEFVGAIAVANVTNPQGLTRVGDTSFVVSPNSGEATYDMPGVGRGSLIVGAVEASNVDLGTEFTNLILAQRGFQASSRVVTTSDSILEELVNLKRG